VNAYQSIELSTGDGLQQLLNPAYPEHVAGLVVVELALWDISPSPNARNNLPRFTRTFTGQQWAKAGIHGLLRVGCGSKIG
jgi:hypothetical protein